MKAAASKHTNAVIYPVRSVLLRAGLAPFVIRDIAVHQRFAVHPLWSKKLAGWRDRLLACQSANQTLLFPKCCSATSREPHSATGGVPRIQLAGAVEAPR